MRIVSALFVLVFIATQGVAANKETIETTQAYIGENGVRVNIFCHNEEGLLEYFNLIVFDDSKLEFSSIEADRGNLWYGYYPTHVDGDHIYVHGVDMGCIDPDWSEPGNPLYHIIFNVKPGTEAGFTELTFATEGVWDGHWNNCSGNPIVPDPDYYDGGVDILGHAGHITIGSDSTNPGQQAIVDVYMHNDLDIFEYFNQILFEQALAVVDSIVPLRGALHYGYYPTHVSADTIFIHGWASGEDCFYSDSSYPGLGLYRIYFTLHEWAPPGYSIPLTFLGEDPIWNHWVGCDLYTTDSFTATDGSIRILEVTAAEDWNHAMDVVQLERAVPNPTTHSSRIRYYLGKPTHATLTIYNAAGKKIRTLVNDETYTGWHYATWNGTDGSGRKVTSGIYFCILRTDSGTLGRKIIIVR